MTDIWCFTCSHELKRLPGGGYIHLDADDLDGCVCIDDEERCEPR